MLKLATKEQKQKVFGGVRGDVHRPTQDSNLEPPGS